MSDRGNNYICESEREVPSVQKKYREYPKLKWKGMNIRRAEETCMYECSVLMSLTWRCESDDKVVEEFEICT